jgi:hypothetical protein
MMGILLELILLVRLVLLGVLRIMMSGITLKMLVQPLLGMILAILPLQLMMQMRMALLGNPSNDALLTI